jgi:hypothetical protein
MAAGNPKAPPFGYFLPGKAQNRLLTMLTA